MEASASSRCLWAAARMGASQRLCVLTWTALFGPPWNRMLVQTQPISFSNIWWHWQPRSALIVTSCHRMNVSQAPVGVWDNEACISKRWGGGGQRNSLPPPPCRSRMDKSADARRPDTLQAVRDISWLLAVVGCDVCHGHDGWLSDLSHYIISVRNPLFLKCLFVSPPRSCRWHLPTHSHCVKPTENVTILQGSWLMVQLLRFN